MRRPIETIIYLTNYVGPKVAAARGIHTHSEAGNRRVENVVRALRAAGYNVRLLSAGWKRADNRWRWYSTDDELLADGLRCEYVPCFDLAPLNAAVCVLATLPRLVGARLSGKRCAVLFYNPTIQSAPPALFARWFLGMPIYLQLEDGTHLLRGIGRLRNLSYRLLLALVRPFISGALVPSAVLADAHPGGKTLVHRGGFSAAPAVRWDSQSGQKLTFLFAGTLDEIRGVDLLLAALDRLDSEARLADAPVEFLVCGSGPLEEEVRRHCRAYKTLDVRFLGFLSRQEYDRVLRQSHVGLALQKHDHPFSRACFPSKVLELMSAGKLVITSTVADIGLLPEGICLRYTCDDPAEIARLIEAVCRAPEEHFPVAVVAAEWLRRTSSAANVAEQLKELIG